MSPNFDEDSELTTLSLAVLADSGWYGVNQTLAADPVWGRGLTLDFLRDSNDISRQVRFPSARAFSTCS